jgi:hypothetical protein
MTRSFLTPALALGLGVFAPACTMRDITVVPVGSICPAAT